jgi:hypothetical protein
MKIFRELNLVKDMYHEKYRDTNNLWRLFNSGGKHALEIYVLGS